MVLSKHCPISLSSLARAILSVPIESDQCALEEAQTLLAFSLLGPSFLFWPEKGWKEGARKGRASCCAFKRSAADAESWGRELSFRSPVCRLVAERAKRRWKGRRALPPSPRGVANVQCRREGDRVLSEAHSGAIVPGSTHVPRSFPRVGRSVSLRLRAEPLGAGRKRGPPCARLPSVRPVATEGATCEQWSPLLCGSSLFK